MATDRSKQWENEGAEAYRKGKDILDNPYACFDQNENVFGAYNSWFHGYRMEQDYWEKQLDYPPVIE